MSDTEAETKMNGVKLISQLGPFRHSQIWALESLYLDRYEFITRLFSLKLHKFCGSDDDRATHDHPWRWWFTFPLTAGYLEVFDYTSNNITNEIWHTVRGWRFHKRGQHRHRVVMLPGQKPFWTFIVCGPVARKWGFWPAVQPGIKRFIRFDRWDAYCKSMEGKSND